MRYAYIKLHRNTYPVVMMARLLHVSVSRFYDWLKNRVSKRTIQRNQQTILVKIAHQETHESYGYVRLTKYLQSRGYEISQYAVRTIKLFNSLYSSAINSSKEQRIATIFDQSMKIYSLSSLIWLSQTKLG